MDQNQKFRFGRTVDDPDTIDLDGGRYEIRLLSENREAFHTALRGIFDLLGDNSPLPLASPIIHDSPRPSARHNEPADYDNETNRHPTHQKHNSVVTHSNATPSGNHPEIKISGITHQFRLSN